jgi:molecular chaperone GrpE (heat shock protein)
MSKSNEKEKTVSEKTEVTEKEETTEEKVKIETPLEIAERVAAEYKDMALRARAEFENYRKNNLILVIQT